MAQRSMMMVRRTYLQIGVMTLLTALVWTGVSIFLAISKTEIANADKDVLSPLTATIDEATLAKLAERVAPTQIQAEALSAVQASASAAINEVTVATTSAEEVIETQQEEL